MKKVIMKCMHVIQVYWNEMINDVKTTMSRLVIAANEPISLFACQQCLAQDC